MAISTLSELTTFRNNSTLNTFVSEKDNYFKKIFPVTSKSGYITLSTQFSNMFKGIIDNNCTITLNLFASSHGGQIIRFQFKYNRGLVNWANIIWQDNIPPDLTIGYTYMCEFTTSNNGKYWFCTGMVGGIVPDDGGESGDLDPLVIKNGGGLTSLLLDKYGNLTVLNDATIYDTAHEFAFPASDEIIFPIPETWDVYTSANNLYFAHEGINRMMIDTFGNITLTGDLEIAGTWIITYPYFPGEILSNDNTPWQFHSYEENFIIKKGNRDIVVVDDTGNMLTLGDIEIQGTI